IRSLYRRSNGQGRKYRGRMNSWSFGEAQRQIEYKARWAGLPVIRLSRRETRGSSLTCPRCGERLQSDKRLKRKLWCGNCRVVMNRDMVAAVNLARRGRVRFARSRPPILLEAQGGAVEAMKGNPTPTVIPGVDAPKLTQPTKSQQNQLESNFALIPSSSIDNRRILRESFGFSTVLPSAMTPSPQLHNLSRVSVQILESPSFSEVAGPLCCYDRCSSSTCPNYGWVEEPHEGNGKSRCSVPSTAVPQTRCGNQARHLGSETPFRLTFR